MINFVRSLIVLLLIIAMHMVYDRTAVYAQTAGLMPNASQVFLDNNGNPLASGTVTTYVPNTSTLKTTWQDAAETIANTNPIVLNAAGRAIIYGDGNYRQVVRDRNGNLIWDALTSAFGTGGASQIGDGTAVGTVLPWSGLVAPTRYAFAYGQELSRVTYSQLYTAITLSTAAACTNGSPILTGIADTGQIPITGYIEASCVAAGTTVIAKTASTVTLNANANITANITAVFFPWGNGNGSTTFNAPDLRGRIIAGRDNLGGTAASRLTTYFNAVGGNGLGLSGGSQSIALGTSNLPAYTPTGTVAITDAGHRHFISNVDTGVDTGAPTSANQIQKQTTFSGAPTVGYLFGGTSTDATIGRTSSATTGITAAFTGVAQGGSATAFTSVQPTIMLNYIIKILPDVNISTLSVVTSLNNMTGDLTCGTSLSCTGQILNVPGTAIHTVAVGAGTNLPFVGVGPGTSAFCLMSNGASADPSFQNCPGAIGSGVTGPGVSVSNNIALWNGTTGNIIKDSAGILPNGVYFQNGKPWADIVAFGAVGNGSTDDHAAIAAAVAAIASLNGGVVYVPPTASGIYCNKSAVTVSTRGIRIVGAGQNSSTISSCGNDNVVFILNNHSVTLENISVYGKGVNNDTGSFGATQNAVEVGTNCIECKISDATILGGKHAISHASGEAYFYRITASASYGSAIFYTTGGGWLNRLKLDQLYIGGVSAGSTFNPWAGLTVYPADTIVSLGGYYIQTIAGGTSAAGAPALKNYGINMVDGTVTWQVLSPTTYYALQMDTGASEIYATQIDMSTPATAGFGMTNTLAGAEPHDFKCIQCIASFNYTYGFKFEAGHNAFVTDSTVGICVLSGCVGVAYLSTWTGGSRYSGGYISTVPTGISISGGTQNLIEGVLIDTTTTGVQIAGNVSNFTVKGVSTSNTTLGLQVQAGTSNYYAITNNICGATTTNCISDAGTGTNKTVTGNDFGWWTLPTVFRPPTDNAVSLGDITHRFTNYFGNGYVQTGAIAVGSLPTCNAAAKAARHFVTDASAALTAGIGTIVTNGGANNVPVVCDGTNWRIG